MQKNIVYGSITAGGNVHIGDKIYVIERDFPHSILFLRIEKGASGYEAMLSVKSEDDLTIHLFRETLNVVISESLFGRVDEFQNYRRGGDGNRYRSAFDTHSPENWETVLADELYNTFFSGDIGTVCCDFLSLLQSHKISDLLLVISTEDEQIQNLPWEMVLPKLTPGGVNELPRDNFGLIRSREKILQQFNRQGPTAEAAPLKLLFIPALPENLPGKSQLLEIEEEQRKIIEAVRSLEATGDQQPKLVMEILDCANLEEIKEALAARSHDIVHISGHGSYVDAVKEGVLYLEDEDGNERQTTGRELGKALNGFSSIKLLVLSACETAVGGSEGSTAEQMAAVGLPAILAMRFSVTDIGARLFTEILYKKLAYGDTLTKAMHDARLALWEHVQERRKNAPTVFTPAEWFTPVLYQNQAIGVLVKKGQYYTETLNRFYPKPAFIRGSHTRLIGEGFIGRKRLLIQLRQSFKQGKAVCLHGLGGLGKTTTAEAFAEHYRRKNGHDILIFRGKGEIQESVILEWLFEKWKESKQPGDFLSNQFKKQLDDPKKDSGQKLQSLIDNYLQGHPTILIFDNFEDIQTDEKDLQQQTIVSESLRIFFYLLLKKAPSSCHILFTTRYRILGFDTELIYIPIDKMSYAEEYRYLNSSETLRQLSEKERDIVHLRIDGHPRGLQILEGLVNKDQNFDLANFDIQVRKVETDIFQNLLLDRILNQLTEVEQAVFSVISVFFSRSSVVALGAVMKKDVVELLPVLASLRDWSLCFWDENERQFEVHALTRVWLKGQEQMTQEHFYELSEGIGDFFQKQPTSEDKLLAKDYFAHATAWDKYANTVFDLVYDLRLAGLYPVAKDLLNEILKKRINPSIKAHAWNILGIIDNNIGDYNQSLESLQLGLQLNSQNEDKNGIGSSLNNIGQHYLEQGENGKALEYMERSLVIRQETNNKYGEGVTLNNIGQAYLRMEQCVIALKYFKNSLFIRRQIGDRVGEGNTLNNIGFCLEKAGKYNRALKYLEDSRQIRSDVGDKIGEGDSLKNIGQVYFSLKLYELAIDYSNRSLEIYGKIGAKTREISALDDIGRSYFALGNYEVPIKCLNSIRTIQREIRDKGGEGNTLFRLGEFYFHNFQNLRVATTFFYMAYQILSEISSSYTNQPENWLTKIKNMVGEEEYDKFIQLIQKKLDEYAQK